MARPRFHRTDTAKQEAILQAAAKEFAKAGYEGASVNRILESAGLSKGGFYYYFDDKADLAATVLSWAYKDALAVIDSFQVPDDPARFWDEIGALMRRSLKLLERSPSSTELVAQLGRAAVDDQELSSRVMQTMSQAVASMVGIWKRGQELGAVRGDLPVEVLVSILQGIKQAVVRAYLPDGRVPGVDELQRIFDLQMDLYRRVASPAPQEKP